MCAKIRKQEALDFHEAPPRGKIEVIPTKPLRSQHDLALAYSPGVAVPCLEIQKKTSAKSSQKIRKEYSPYLRKESEIER